jgi:hypothetical protein
MPYGFPSAEGLKELICNTFDVANTRAAQFLADRYDHPLEKFIEFRESFWKSGKPSIDEFLEHRGDFIEVGKLAIAYCLIPYEDEEKLFSPDGHPGDWYQYLVGKMNAPFEDFGKNRLSVVTFNYDRSLEHYLLTTLQNAHGPLIRGMRANSGENSNCPRLRTIKPDSIP